MKQLVDLTLELLIRLKDEGFRALISRHKEDFYVPSKQGIEELSDQISITPLAEDQLIPISDAMQFFYELDLAESKIKLE